MVTDTEVLFSISWDDVFTSTSINYHSL